MKQQRLIIMLFLLVLHQLTFAAPRTFRQAQAIAERQAAKLGIVIAQEAMTQSRSRYATPSKAKSDPTAPYYVFANGEDKGFTIVSGDDRLPEIVGYADHGTYNENQMPNGLKAYLKAYEQMATAIENGDENALKADAERRALITMSTYIPAKVEPLLGDINWDQNNPYNGLCPEYRTGKHCVTGCVATAMAQVMRYYKYPEKLQNKIEGYTTKSYGYELKGAEMGEAYDWSNMLDTYTSNQSYTQEQADAVAKLMYHCGLAAKMDYAPDGSSAYLSPQVLAHYFGYDADLMQKVYRYQFRLSEWRKLIETELLAARPIIYGGTSSSAGHQFVCDGADGNGLYHINWGWNGMGNGYYDLTILDPDYHGTGGGTTADGFNKGTEMLIGIAPDNGKADSPLATVPHITVLNSHKHRIDITNGKRSNSTQKFELSLSADYANKTFQAFGGDIAIGIKKTDGSYEPIASYANVGMKAMEESGRYYYHPTRFTLSYAFPVGATTLYEIYRTSGGEWQAMSYEEGCHPYELTATATTLTLQSTKLKASLVATTDQLLSGKNNEFVYNVTNNSSYEYFGNIYIYSSTTSEMPSQPSCYEYLNLTEDSRVRRTFNLKPKAGDLYVWLTDQEGNVLTEGKFIVERGADPQLKMIAKSINTTPDEYEEELAYYEAYRVKMPVIRDDKATITFTLQNDGGDYTADIYLVTNGYDKGFTKQYSEQTTQTFNGDGAITTVTFEVSPDDVNGYRSIASFMQLEDRNVKIDYSELKPESLEGLPTNLYINEVVGYIAGKEDTGVGQIIATSGNRIVKVYSLNGQLVKRIAVQNGKFSLRSLPKGIYIVDGKKVVVK